MRHRVRRLLVALSIAVLGLNVASRLCSRSYWVALTQRQDLSFWFDPQYGAFLDGVARLTPPSETILLVIPPGSEMHLFQAAYQLAPRRIVTQCEYPAVRYVAIYLGVPLTCPPNGVPIPGGLLITRR